MTDKTVFEFNDYKRFLEATEEHRRLAERGFRRRLAEAIGCQSGYVSQVLNSEAHFSLEQGLRVASFIGLEGKSKKYFLLLIEKARAGTRELREHFELELRTLREEHLNIKERVSGARILSEIEQTVYYSSWHYLAIHMLSTLQGFNEPSAIAEALRLPGDVVNKAILFLLQVGILEQHGGKLRAGVAQVHLNKESPLIRQHHTNWRLAAIQSLNFEKQTDVHYSTVSTLSKEDAEKLRADIVKLIEHYVSTVQPSKEETMVGFNVDFYSMIRN